MASTIGAEKNVRSDAELQRRVRAFSGPSNGAGCATGHVAERAKRFGSIEQDTALQRSIELRSLTNDRRVLIALLHLSEHRRRPQTSCLTKALSLSASRLEHLFTSEIGHSMSAVATSYRLHHAAINLADLTRPVKVVQIECGFRDAANFAHQFRRHFAVSPTAYRHASRVMQQGTPIQCTCSARLLGVVSCCNEWPVRLSAAVRTSCKRSCIRGN